MTQREGLAAWMHVVGGAHLVRQARAAGLAGELTIIISLVTLGAGKRLSGGFGESLELGHLAVRQSRSRRSSVTA